MAVAGEAVEPVEAVEPRRKRADAVRNTEAVLEAAKAAFAELGVDAVFDKSTEIDCLLAYCLTQSRKLETAANDDSRNSLDSRLQSA